MCIRDSYNTLRLFAENDAAQMITIDEHRVCYDGDISAHAHFICKHCRKVYDLFNVGSKLSPLITNEVEGHKVHDVQLYYKGICHECSKADDCCGH